MKKLAYLIKEFYYLMKKDRLYVLAVLFVVLLLVSVLVYQLTPAAVVTFVYAGV